MVFKRSSILVRYEFLGGIERIIDILKKGGTLSGVAQKVGISRETVRLDLIKLMGLEAYKNIKRKRTNIFSSLDECLSINNEISEKKKMMRQRIFKIFKNRLKNLEEIKVFKSNYMHIKLKNKKTVLIRFSHINKKLRDYFSGYYRFHITKKIEKFDFVIFILLDEASYNSYLFKAKEIAHLGTLALRFKDNLGGLKYKFALDDWNILKKE